MRQVRVAIEYLNRRSMWTPENAVNITVDTMPPWIEDRIFDGKSFAYGSFHGWGNTAGEPFAIVEMHTGDVLLIDPGGIVFRHPDATKEGE